MPWQTWLTASCWRNMAAVPLEIDAAWREEVRRRIDEIDSGRVQGIPLEETLAKARKILGR